MYEVTVSTLSEQRYLLDHLSQEMFDYIGKIDGTCASLNKKHRSYFCFACSDTFRFQAKRLLAESISRVLTLGYKNIFVRRLLDVGDGNFYQNVLVDTMCVFDHQYDANFIASIIDSEQNIFLDGYYNFRMKDVKRKWENVVNMILENNYILSDSTLILEFLQYLLQSIESKTHQLSICLDQDSYTLYDSKGRLIQNSPTLSETATPEEEAMVNAICSNPHKLKVYHSQSLSQEFCDVANALFDVQYVQVH